MKKSIKYETPVMEVTRFELGMNIMIGEGQNESGNGDEVHFGGESTPDETVSDIPLPW